MRIYFDCSYHAVEYPLVRSFNKACDDFVSGLIARGVEILNYSTPGLPFDPHVSEISDFVAISDVVVALGQYPSSGFSSLALQTSVELQIPRYLFTPGHMDVLVKIDDHGPAYFCLFSSAGYPAWLLRFKMNERLCEDRAVAR